VVRVTGIDPWFIEQIQHIQQVAEQIAAAPALDVPTLQLAKQTGFSDAQIAELRQSLEAAVREIAGAGRAAGIITRSTPAPRSSRPAPRTCTRPTTKGTRYLKAPRPR